MAVQQPVNRGLIQQIILGVLTLFAIYLCYTIVEPFLMPAMAALALAVLFHPVHRTLRAVMRNRNAAAGVSVLMIVLLTVLPSILLGSAIIRDLKELYNILAAKSSAGGGWEYWISHRLEGPLGFFGINVEDPEFSIKTILQERVKSASATLMRIAQGAVGNIAGLFMDSLITLFTLFFLFRDGKVIRRKSTSLLPLDDSLVERLFGEVERTIIANMYGLIAVAALQGILTGTAFLLLGLPSPAMWGAVAGMCSLIPLVGPPIVWVPAAIYFVVSAQYVKAAILTGLGVGVIGLADNFVRPYVVSGQVKMHPLLIFIALLGGAQAFGIMGLFIGPAVLTVTLALLEVVRDRSREEAEAAAAIGPAATTP
jgi:predicted PurR-regulated permease PerM